MFKNLQQPTYERIPASGLTQLNFINTLPCQVNVDYVIGDVTRSVTLNATSYSFEHDLKDASIEVTARLVTPVCGGIQFTETQWKGQMRGNSTKVQFNSFIPLINQRLGLFIIPFIWYSVEQFIGPLGLLTIDSLNVKLVHYFILIAFVKDC